MVFQVFMDKQFLPVLACVITIFLILLIRPGFLIHSSENKSCPYCLNKWLVTLAVLIVGGVTYAVVNQGTPRPSIAIYNQ